MEFKDLLGMTVTEISGNIGDEKIVFSTAEGKRYVLFHDRD